MLGVGAALPRWLAYLLKVPYLPNSFRLPFRQFLYQRAGQIQRELLSMRELGDEYRRQVAAYRSSTEETLTVPLFLVAVLARIQSVNQFLEVVCELRSAARSFRALRRELDLVLANGDLKAAKTLRSAIHDDAGGLLRRFPYVPVAAATSAILTGLGSSTLPVTAIHVNKPRDACSARHPFVLRRASLKLV
jgi:hypothetical protein